MLVIVFNDSHLVLNCASAACCLNMDSSDGASEMDLDSVEVKEAEDDSSEDDDAPACTG